MRRLAPHSAGLFVLLGLVAAPVARARAADDTIRRPGDHPLYSVELEPHLPIGWGGLGGRYGGDAALGLGARFSIPVVHNGFVPTINNSIAVTFGIDWVHYFGCYNTGANCSADYITLPVALQWNFYVSQHWSVFGEPGFAIYHGFFSTCQNFDGTFCSHPSGFSETGIVPALFLGGRYHFTDRVSLTMRIGYPTLSVGVSFFP
jgi:hypothetical protein